MSYIMISLPNLSREVHVHFIKNQLTFTKVIHFMYVTEAVENIKSNALV